MKVVVITVILFRATVLTHGHEIITNDGIYVGPFSGVALKQPLNEGPGKRANSRRHVVLVLLDSHVGVLESLGFKGRLTN